MYKLDIKHILPVIVFVLLLTPIVTSSLLDLEQKKTNEIIKQKLLQAKQIQKETEEKIYLMGKFDPVSREDFVLIPAKYTAVKNEMYLRKEALNAFLEMQNAAERDKIEFKIASATRNFIYQKDIWNKKWNGATLVNGKNLSESVPDGLKRFKKILEYSAVPGISRHHWGTDIDINDANPLYFETRQGKKEYAWLAENAWKFGFCQPYNLKGKSRPTGYNEEKWHWSYLPLAKNFTLRYKNLIKNENIKDFEGDQYAISQDLINNYALGINSDCL